MKTPLSNRLKVLSQMQRLNPVSAIPVWLVIWLSAFAQQPGIIEGRLVNRTNPSIIARGAELEVIALRGGMSVIKSATTDASGKFRIEALPTDGPLMIRANYKGAYYHSPINLDAGGTAHVELEVFESTTSMRDIQAEKIQMAFQLVGNQLRSLEIISFNNRTSPPKTFANPAGSFRFSKAPGIIELPRLNVLAPGSSMPVVQSALESPDGSSYYSLYPLRPGVTTFEVQQVLPYEKRSYTYRKKFFYDVPPVEIVVNPSDLELSGPGLSKVHTDTQSNIAVYSSAAIKSGSEIAWTFSGGTPLAEPASPKQTDESEITVMPNSVDQKALIIGPLLLLGFVLALWYAFNRFQSAPAKPADSRNRHLSDFREQLLRQVADLDYRYENQKLSRQDFLKQRDASMRQLRRISLLLKR